MNIDLDRFRSVFFQECEEHLAVMESALLQLADASGDPELLNALFRAAHSIKGASATFSFNQVAAFTHAMENLLDRMRGNLVSATPERLELLLDAVDILRALIESARTGEPCPVDPSEMLGLLTVAQRSGEFDRTQPPVLRKDSPKRDTRENSAKPSVQDTVANTEFTIRFRPNPDILRQGLDPAFILRDLQNLGEIRSVAVNSCALPALREMDPEACYLSWEIHIATARRESELRDAFAFVEDGADLTICASPRATPRRNHERTAAEIGIKGAAGQGTIRVATGKVDKIIDLVGELVIAQSMASQILAEFQAGRLTELAAAFSEIERYTRELQERIMGIRMLPIGTVFSRFPRLVHDLAVSMGKRITLEMSGEETELDKGVVERMSDPLMHLIRNAADHGLESSEERLAAGKPEEGRITLRASHQGGSVVVEVADDGRGLDAARIRAKAIEQGLIRPSDELTEAQTNALIFEPGFSTAAAVTGISGRGVGMDVVKRNVEALNGSVSVASEPGRGACVRVKLPLTMAILDGLLLRVGAQVYVLPLIAIIESLRPLASQLSCVAGQSEVVTVRGQTVPLVRLHALFNVPDAVTDPTRGLVALAEDHGQMWAFLVDELLGQQQVVIKALETNFRKVEGVVGATILGDGRAALILDVSGIVQLARTARHIVHRAA